MQRENGKYQVRNKISEVIENVNICWGKDFVVLIWYNWENSSSSIVKHIPLESFENEWEILDYLTPKEKWMNDFAKEFVKRNTSDISWIAGWIKDYFEEKKENK